MNIIDPRKETFELVDLDGNFCIFTHNRLDANKAGGQYYIYELCINNKKAISGLRQTVENENEFGGSIISKLPIYIKGIERKITSCEFLGLTTSLAGHMHN